MIVWINKIKVCLIHFNITISNYFYLSSLAFCIAGYEPDLGYAYPWHPFIFPGNIIYLSGWIIIYYFITMKNLFDEGPYNEVMQRLQHLTPGAKRNWGKMEVAQMLAHSAAAFKVPLSKKKLKRMLLGRLLGWMFKSALYNDTPWKQNMPTSPTFIIKDQRNFDAEKVRLIGLIQAFYTAGPDGISKYPHPFFGNITSEQWGKSMYKHLDHHLKQFGV